MRMKKSDTLSKADSKQENTIKPQKTTVKKGNKTTKKLQKTTSEEESKTTNKLQKTTSKEENTKKLQKTTMQNQNTALMIGEKLQSEEVREKFLYFLNNIDTFIGIGQKAENDLIIPNEILSDETSYSTSIRVSQKILSKFNNFCNTHKNYSKIQIINFALAEFVNKYDKDI